MQTAEKKAYGQPAAGAIRRSSGVAVVLAGVDSVEAEALVAAVSVVVGADSAVVELPAVGDGCAQRNF
jgi:hypothetical protein